MLWKPRLVLGTLLSCSPRIISFLSSSAQVSNRLGRSWLPPQLTTATPCLSRHGIMSSSGDHSAQAGGGSGGDSRVQKNDRTRVTKRSDYLSWDDYFMAVAFLSAMRSKDPSTQVGACIVNEDKRIVGMGYNGFPAGCSDDELPWNRGPESDLDTKYPYICHAEMNAILNKNSADVRGCTIYVALFPCNECAKLIIQSGIKRVVYKSDKYKEDWKFVASRRLFDMAGVECLKHTPKQTSITIDFGQVEGTKVAPNREI